MKLKKPSKSNLHVAKKAAKSPKKKSAPKKTVFTTPVTRLHPTTTGKIGTVKYYFFPTDSGAWWKLRTVKFFVDEKGKIAHADTIFTESRVIENKAYSLQGLPLLLTSDTTYRINGEGMRTESAYYVDDSIAMTVFNNSVSHSENRIFLVAPVITRNAWHEKLEDTTITAIAGFVDSVAIPLGVFDSVLVTLTQSPFADMRKYYVPGYGIVKTMFRSVGPGGRGFVIVTTEMVEFRRPDEEKNIR
ncbi:MAG: hypothetical protein ABI778_08995 [Ignavibacteriota bacterium]